MKLSDVERRALEEVVECFWEPELADYRVWREENPEQDPDKHILLSLMILRDALMNLSNT